MIPQTAAALVALLFLVAPGLVFEGLRRSRRPDVQRSAFEEASSVALASALFTALALLGVVGLNAALHESDAIDATSLLATPTAYVAEHPGKVAVHAVLLVCSAIGMAIWTHKSLEKKGTKKGLARHVVSTLCAEAEGAAKLNRQSLLWQVLEDRDGKHIAATVRTREGHVISGLLGGYGRLECQDEAAYYFRYAKWTTDGGELWSPDEGPETVIVPEREIVLMWYQYVD